jgi:hypothetical protein
VIFRLKGGRENVTLELGTHRIRFRASPRHTVCKAATLAAATAALPATGILRVVGALDVISSRSQLSHYLRAIRALKLHTRCGCTAPIGVARYVAKSVICNVRASLAGNSVRGEFSRIDSGGLGNRVNKRAVTYFNSPSLCPRPNYADANGIY